MLFVSFSMSWKNKAIKLSATSIFLLTMFHILVTSHINFSLSRLKKSCPSFSWDLSHNKHRSPQCPLDFAVRIKLPDIREQSSIKIFSHFKVFWCSKATSSSCQYTSCCCPLYFPWYTDKLSSLYNHWGEWNGKIISLLLFHLWEVMLIFVVSPFDWTDYWLLLTYFLSM